MKKLQNNFTTPEQSKRLLELGVPADSADCFWFDERDLMFLKDILYSDEAKDGEWVRATDYTPCWSVGRLIEIYAIAMDSDVIDFDTYANSHCVLKELLEKYERNRDLLDFSKLEE